MSHNNDNGSDDDDTPTIDDDLQVDWNGPDLTTDVFSPSVAFGLLADKRDRFMLYILDARGGTMSVDELAMYLAALESETVPSLTTDEMQRRILVDLNHAEIPKLTDHGLITYDSDSNAVTLADGADRLQPYLEFAKSREREDVETFLNYCTK